MCSEVSLAEKVVKSYTLTVVKCLISQLSSVEKIHNNSPVIALQRYIITQ